MNSLPPGGNVDELLQELLKKKQWLDTMIEGLEAAQNSPQHQLIEMVAKTFGDAGGKTPRVDLRRESKEELAALAEAVGQPSRKRRRSK